MKKPKSKSKQIAAQKRATKRGNRLKETRKKASIKRQSIIKMKKEEKKKVLEFIKKLEEARNKG